MSRRRPAYLDALARHLQATGIEAGKVVMVEIRHDDDCAHWSGKPCDCEPEIETGARVDRKHGVDR